MIYFVQAGARGPVKIGKADDVATRIANLATAHYEHLSLLATLDVPDGIERSLHRLLRRHCIRGEWFASCPEVIAVVDLAVEGKLPEFPRKNEPVVEVVEASAERPRITGGVMDPVQMAKEVAALPIGDAEAVQIMRGLGHKISARTLWSIRKGKGSQTLATLRAVQALLAHFGRSTDDVAA